MKILKKEKMLSVLSPLMIVGIALAFISILLLVVGANPGKVLLSLLKGAFGSKRGVISTLQKSVPICLSAFAVALAKKAGIFNIGVEGQLIFGALGSVTAGIFLKGLPAVVHVPVALLSGVVFGMLYSFIPAMTYVKRQVNLLVVFIMMNNLSKLFCTYTVVALIRDPKSVTSATLPIEKTAYLPNLLTSPGKLNIGILILAVIGILIYIFFYKTVHGYELTACGLNREAAAYSGIKTKRYILGALVLGGALAGLAGAIEVQGTYYRVYDGFSPGYGFDGIPIALLCNNNPLAMFIGSILFAALRVGSNTMQIEHGVSTEIVSVIQGILVTLIACEGIIRHLAGKLVRTKKEVA